MEVNCTLQIEAKVILDVIQSTGSVELMNCSSHFPLRFGNGKSTGKRPLDSFERRKAEDLPSFHKLNELEKMPHGHYLNRFMPSSAS